MQLLKGHHYSLPHPLGKNRSTQRSSGMRTSDKELGAKKAWHRPDFVSFDTGMEVTAYFSRD
ncbi:hypothetical protein Scel_26260 [Streptomyces cellostaticus]|nr:hypothetical protein Scel_26260 [Streptomyces cellostaticus]